MIMDARAEGRKGGSHGGEGVGVGWTTILVC